MKKTRLTMLKPRVATLNTNRVPVLDRTNPNATPRLRGRRAVVRRTRYLNKHPFCVQCQQQGITRLADELDHVVPLERGGADDDENLMGLCTQHHREKTAEEARERARRE